MFITERMPVATNDLLTFIFTNTRLPVAVQCARWIQASPRFRTFVETYRDKIRKKVRSITEAESYLDLQAELAAAYFLSQERKFAVEYEKYGTGKQRGPDFSVTYKTHIRFDVEVTRLRGLRGNRAEGATAPEPGKLANTICVKLPQLTPSMINVVMLAADDAWDNVEDAATALRKAVALLQERAEHKDDEFFVRRGFLGARDFWKHYGRLSAVRISISTPDALPVLWLQPQARHPLPADLANLLRR